MDKKNNKDINNIDKKIKYETYLQLLKKRLKKFEYLDKHDIKLIYIDSASNDYLDEQDHSTIKYSEMYKISDAMDKNSTLNTKILLKKYIDYNKEINFFCEEIIYSLPILELNDPIKIKFLGFAKRKCINEYYFTSCPTLDIITISIFVFEVLDSNFDKKYIFFPENHRIFYKTDKLIKLDYVIKGEFITLFNYNIIKYTNTIDIDFNFIDIIPKIIFLANEYIYYNLLDYTFFYKQTHIYNGENDIFSNIRLSNGNYDGENYDIIIDDVYTKVSHTKASRIY